MKLSWMPLGCFLWLLMRLNISSHLKAICISSVNCFIFFLYQSTINFFYFSNQFVCVCVCVCKEYSHFNQSKNFKYLSQENKYHNISHSPNITTSNFLDSATCLVPCWWVLRIDRKEGDNGCLGHQGAVVLRGKPDCISLSPVNFIVHIHGKFFKQMIT